MAQSDVTRAAFLDSSSYFVDTVARIPGDAWDRPALGEWSTRDLVGHTSRALLTLEAYLAKRGREVSLSDSAAYFRAALGDRADDAAVVARGRAAGSALGDEPAVAVRAIADRVLPAVGRAEDDAIVGTPWGGMRLIDYLPTRVFELCIHTLDLAAALDIESELPPNGAIVTWEVVARLARQAGSENKALRALTGRSELPLGYTVLSFEC